MIYSFFCFYRIRVLKKYKEPHVDNTNWKVINNKINICLEQNYV